MDFKDQILQLSDRIKKQKDSISTEEATKKCFHNAIDSFFRL